MSVTYKIKADGSGYTKTVNRLRGDTQKFSGDVKSQMMGVGTAIKGAFAYVGINAFKGVMNDITELSRLARTIGDDFDGFQTITNAARQFGLEAETVADAIKDLDVKMTDGAMGAKAYAEVFELVGISLDEAMGMTQLERFYAFADAVKAADGQISSFSADEINDAMFRMVPLLELGSQGIKNLGNEYVKFSESQRKMAEEGSKQWDNMVQNVKWLTATIVGWLIPTMLKVAHTWGAVLGEGAIQMGLFAKGMKAVFTGDWSGAKAAFSTLGDMTTTTLKRISEEIADVWDDAGDAADELGKGGKGSSVETKGSKDNRSALEKELNKQLEEQEKRRQAIMSDEEKLLDLQKRRIEAEKELGELGEKLFKDGATDEEALKLAELQTKWEKLKTEEQEKQLQLAQKIKTEVEKDTANEQTIRDKIEAEKRGREEIGMTDEQILKRRKAELKKMQDDMVTGTFSSPADVAKAEGEIEKKKKEIAELERSEDQRKKDEGEKLTSTQDEIAAERKEREEIGMSDEDILARRKAELKQKEDTLAGLGEDANGDGKIDSDDDRFKADKQLDIENLKTEIKNLEQGGGSQGSQAGVITSQLASIGGGGATASFTNDPILSENKRQSNLLEQLVKLQGGTTEGGGNLVTPEL
jgi:hypothetical protein